MSIAVVVEEHNSIGREAGVSGMVGLELALEVGACKELGRWRRGPLWNLRRQASEG